MLGGARGRVRLKGSLLATPAFRPFSFRPPSTISSLRNSFLSTSSISNFSSTSRSFRTQDIDECWIKSSSSESTSIEEEDFNRLLPLEQIRRCFDLPVPTKYTELKDPRFDVLFFGSTALKAAMERENQHFYEAYHLERLEFVGDRIWSEVVAQSVFLLAPFAGSRVGLLNDVTFRLCTNAIAAELAIEVDLDDGTQRAQAADRFEAYLAALSFSNGRQSLLQFLVPFVQREFSARFNSVPALSSHQEEAVRVRPHLPTDSPAEALLQSSLSRSRTEESSSTSNTSSHALDYVTKNVPRLGTGRSAILRHDFDKANTTKAPHSVSSPSPRADPAEQLDQSISTPPPPTVPTSTSFSATTPAITSCVKEGGAHSRSPRLHFPNESYAWYSFRSLEKHFFRHDFEIFFPDYGLIRGSGQHLADAISSLLREMTALALVTQNPDRPYNYNKLPFNLRNPEAQLLPCLVRYGRAHVDAKFKSTLTVEIPGQPPVSISEWKLGFGRLHRKHLFRRAVEAGVYVIEDEHANTPPALAVPRIPLDKDSTFPRWWAPFPSYCVTVTPPQTPTSNDHLSKSPTPLRFSSPSEALRKIEAIRNAKLKYIFELVLPSYGTVSARGRFPRSTYPSIVDQMEKLGALEEDRTQKESIVELPLRLAKPLENISIRLSHYCRLHVEAKMKWTWTLELPGHPTLTLHDGGRSQAFPSWLSLLTEGVKAGILVYNSGEPQALPSSTIVETTSSAAVEDAVAEEVSPPTIEVLASEPAQAPPPASPPAITESPTSLSDCDERSSTPESTLDPSSSALSFPQPSCTLPSAVHSNPSPLSFAEEVNRSPPISISSNLEAYEKIQAIEGSKIRFDVEYDLPGYGTISATGSRHSDVQAQLIASLIRIGALTQDPTKYEVTQKLPLNITDPNWSVVWSLDSFCDSQQNKARRTWKWTLEVPGHPVLVWADQGDHNRKSRWGEVVRRARSEGILLWEYKSSPSSPSESYVPATSSDPTPELVQYEEPISFLDRLVEPSLDGSHSSD